MEKGRVMSNYCISFFPLNLASHTVHQSHSLASEFLCQNIMGRSWKRSSVHCKHCVNLQGNWNYTYWGVVWIKEYPKWREKSRASINCSESKAECVVVKPWGLKEEIYPTGKFRSLSGNFLIGSHFIQRKKAEESLRQTQWPARR